MKTLLFGAVLAYLLQLPSAAALDIPQQASADSRVRVVTYNADDVVALNAKRYSSVHIVFAPGEEILDVASGFSAGWEFKVRRHHLYLKARSAAATGDVAGLIPPAPGKWDTNVEVTTRPSAGGERSYTFDLALVPDKDRRKLYRVTFKYPEADVAARAAAAAEEETRRRLATPPAVRNTRYTMQVGRRSKALQPQSAYDDGRFTYLTFGANQELPAVFMLSGQDRTETLVNTHMVGSQLVVQQLAPELVLRLGRQVVHVFNEAYDPTRASVADESTATTVDGVKRVIKGAER